MKQICHVYCGSALEVDKVISQFKADEKLLGITCSASTYTVFYSKELMPQQLYLFPELALKLVSLLDERAEDYAKHNLPADDTLIEAALATAYKEGASTVLGEIIDLLKKYTDLREA